MANRYECPVAELMAGAAAALDYPTSRGAVVGWFAENYTEVKASTIRAFIIGLTANEQSAPLQMARSPRSAVHTTGRRNAACV
jgi:hypothetical protein